jgi:hypothetical protein
MAPIKPTSVLEGLEQVLIQPFKSLNSLRKTVESEKNKLLQQGSPPLKTLIFGPINVENFHKLSESDEGVGSGARYGYDNEKERLVVTVFAKQEHESFVINLGEELKATLIRMGHNTRTLVAVGCADYESAHGVKQPDASFKPATRTSSTSPPSIVFEAGYSETLPQLRRDAEWWLTNAPNEVNIVVLVAVRPRNKILIIEKWVLVERKKDGQTGTASRPAPKFTLPTRTVEVKVEPEPKGSATFVSKGGPLVFEFDKLMDRAPVSPETDITLSDANLAELAADLWGVLN